MIGRIKWNSTPEDARLIAEIVKRWRDLEPKPWGNPIDMRMDLTACHLNGCALDLRRLLDADNFNFIHDVTGIARNINRETGKLENLFRPRFSKRENDQ